MGWSRWGNGRLIFKNPLVRVARHRDGSRFFKIVEKAPWMEKFYLLKHSFSQKLVERTWQQIAINSGYLLPTVPPLGLQALGFQDGNELLLASLITPVASIFLFHALGWFPGDTLVYRMEKDSYIWESSERGNPNAPSGISMLFALDVPEYYL